MSERSRMAEPHYRSDPSREQLLWRMTIGGMVFLAVAYPWTLLRSLEFGFSLVNAIQAAIVCFTLGLILARRRLDVRVATACLQTSVMAFALVGIASYGVVSPGILVLPFVPVLGSTVFGHRAALVPLVVGTTVLALVAVLHVSGVLHDQIDARSYAQSWVSWTGVLVIQAVLALWYLFVVAPIHEGLRRHSERLEAVLRGILNDAVVVVDPDTGAILQVNQRMCAMYGCSSEEAFSRDERVSRGRTPRSYGERTRNLGESRGQRLRRLHGREETAHLRLGASSSSQGR